jgi:large subunit ribosomal protein L18
MALTKLDRRQRIRFRIRKTITGTVSIPRLSVFRSNKEIYAQLIDDVSGHTLVSASSREKDIAAVTATKIEKSALVGKALAAKALAKGIEACAFDRAGYLYHGRVKSLAEGAREGGLKF